MKLITTIFAGISLFVLALSGCGSGGNTSKLQQKTATVTFSTVSSAHIDPLQGIQISAKLPAGATITDVSTALVARTGSLLGSPYYSPSTQIISFIVTSIPVPIKFGTFAVLKCDITPGFSLDQSSFESINTPFPDLQMVSGNIAPTEDLTKKIPVTLSVSFGY
jgi:hypothetical protein